MHPSAFLPGQILLPQYLMMGLSNLDETYREYSQPRVGSWAVSKWVSV